MGELLTGALSAVLITGARGGGTWAGPAKLRSLAPRLREKITQKVAMWWIELAPRLKRSSMAVLATNYRTNNLRAELYRLLVSQKKRYIIYCSTLILELFQNIFGKCVFQSKQKN